MHDDPRLTSFMASVRDAYTGSTPPAPGDELRALFATGSEIAVTPATITTPRRRRMLSDLLKAVPGKVAAGLLGATLAYTGLGAAGALPAPLSLASSDDDTEEVVLDDTTTTTLGDEDDDTTTTTLADDADDGDDDDGDDTDGDDEQVDVSLVPVPTSVSEAAHNHAFDEACGNHGKYVSHFARTGTEPECATEAREADANGDTDQHDAEVTSDGDTDDDGKDKAHKNNKGNGKADKSKGGKGGKGKGRS